jgi:predicted SAM-dependent methyltransferase
MREANVLNICGGNIKPLDDLFTPNTDLLIKSTLHVDRCYFSDLKPQTIEANFYKEKGQYYLNHEIFNFLENTILKFDVITIYRFLEHVSFTQVLYFIYLVSRIVNRGGIIDVIVPDYHELAKMILNERTEYDGFEAHNILLTTELLNEPSNPHASIWTKARLKYFWELEFRFKELVTFQNFDFDGRDIYLRAQFERV